MREKEGAKQTQKHTEEREGNKDTEGERRKENLALLISIYMLTHIHSCSLTHTPTLTPERTHAQTHTYSIHTPEHTYAHSHTHVHKHPPSPHQNCNITLSWRLGVLHT